MMKYLCTVFAVLLFAGCSETFTDARDGRTYKIARIGSQTWMGENLDYKTAESSCADGDERNCEKYGRLYAWNEALGICPDGWRLPSRDDFLKLVNDVGGEVVAGAALKSGSGWFKKGNGNDRYDFSGLPAGFKNGAGKFDGIGGYAYFWSSSEGEDDMAYYMFLDFSSDAAKMNAFVKTDARSVRCVKK